MKKKILYRFLSFVMILSVLFVASCNKNKNAKLELKTKTDKIEIVVGTTINWEEYVSIKYNDKEIDFDNVNVQLEMGNPTIVGVCKYYLYCNYEGKSAELRVDVKYISDSSKELLINVTNHVRVEVGTIVDPKQYFTVTYGNETLDNNNAIITKVSGDINVVGSLVYDISYTHLGITKTENLTIEIFRDIDPLLVQFEEALKKTYDSYTFMMSFDTSDGYHIMDLETFSNGNYKIDYNEYLDGDDINKYAYKLFLEEDNEYVYVYEYDEATSKWTNTPITHAAWKATDDNGNLIYANYYPIMMLPAEYNLDVNDFEVVNGRILCKSAKLNIVGENIVSQKNANVEYREVEIVIDDNGNIAKIIVKFDGEDELGQYSAVHTIEYSEYNEASFTLPDVEPKFEDAPKHIDPNIAAVLTSEQKNMLEQALLKQYATYAMEYMQYVSNGKTIISEKDLVYNDLVYIAFEEYNNGQLDLKTNYYFKEEAGKYYIYFENAETKTLVKEEIAANQLSSYIPFALLAFEFGFESDWFGFANGKYIAKADALNAAENLLLQDPTYSLVALELILDDNCNVTEIYYVVKVDNAYGSYYFYEKYSYSNFDDVQLEDVSEGDSVLSLLDESKTDVLNTAFSKDYTNATVLDNLSGSYFFFDGNNIVGYIQTENGLAVDTYKVIDGKYYEVTSNGNIEIPYNGSFDPSTGYGEGFTYFVPVADFSQIDLTKVKYNTLNESYYINASDLSITDFIFYFDYTFEFEYFEIKLNEDGYVSEIIAGFKYLNSNNETTFGEFTILSYSEFGTTTVS